MLSDDNAGDSAMVGDGIDGIDCALELQVSAGKICHLHLSVQSEVTVLHRFEFLFQSAAFGSSCCRLLPMQ